MVRGYWNKEQETAESFTAGWLHSGDVARIDEEGFVYIVDRAKDMVIRGARTSTRVEVEAALFEHPAVADVAVIGVPHDVLGRRGRGGRRPAARLQRHRRRALAPRAGAPGRLQGARPTSGSGPSHSPATPKAKCSNASCARALMGEEA